VFFFFGVENCMQTVSMIKPLNYLDNMLKRKYAKNNSIELKIYKIFVLINQGDNDQAKSLRRRNNDSKKFTGTPKTKM
jgi:hypothetical protein